MIHQVCASIYSHPDDCGDYVVVINARHVVVSGNKRTDKVYKHHTGYPGGVKEITFDMLLEKKPEEVRR